MRSIVRRLAAPSAAAYLLAGWLAAALHSHAHSPSGHAQSGSDRLAENVCTACSCGHHHRGEPAQEEEQGSQDEHEHGHHCVVCQYLAKPPLTVAAVLLVAAGEQVSPVAEPAAPALRLVAPSAWWSRGPPIT